MSRRYQVIAAGLVLGACLNLATADEATDTFNSVFGRDIQRVTATADPADDVALAEQLVKAAGESRISLGLMTLLCENAYNLGKKYPSGYDTAIEAMKLLSAASNEKSESCREKTLSIRQLQYHAAKGPKRKEYGEALIALLVEMAEDRIRGGNFTEAANTARQALALAGETASASKQEITVLLKNLMPYERAAQQVQQAKARLKSDPDDEANRNKLVFLLLAELDNPAQAAAFLSKTGDEVMRTYVPLAAKDPQDLQEGALLELANWYRGMAEKATIGKAAMLKRAKTYYEAYLRSHATQDAARAAGAAFLQKVSVELTRTDDSDPAGWKELVNLVDPARHTVRGRWRREGSSLITSYSEGSLIAVPVAPDGDYEVRVKFVRSEGSCDVNVILPVGGTACSLILSGWDGAVSGLEMIHANRAMYTSEGSVRPGRLVNGHEYTLDVKVLRRNRQAQISVNLDSRSLIRWQGAESALRPPQGAALPQPRLLGLGAYASTVTFSSVSLRMLSGTAKTVDVVFRKAPEVTKPAATPSTRPGPKTPQPPHVHKPPA